ncbi:MAG: Oligopeptide transporter, family, partial [Verrucomicrobiales bacterium]|nr:Oligopeptide transporter, family [Verrucomicrobiales bacterium]
LATLGVFMAVPMKRQMINIEQLKFPSGIAAAATLQSLHGKGAGAARKAKSLAVGGAIGAVITWFRDGGRPFAIPASIPFPGKLMGVPLGSWTLAFDMSTIMVASGAIIGWKVGWSMLLGATINYVFLAPWMAQLGAIDINKIGYRSIVSWSTWPGSALLVTSALLTFAFSWRTIARSFGSLGNLFKKRSFEEDAIARIEVPDSWFLLGTILSGLGCIVILYLFFGTSIWMGILSVVLTFFLSLVSSRATGESDITPMGAMGKITQLTFGIIAPTNIVTNLMTASVTAGAASSSADLLTDLKSGYILGANPRKQFIAQFLGIFAGLIVVIPAFYQLVPDASVLGSEKWPAPSAQVWAAVARLLANGLHSLHPAAQSGLWIGGIVGILFALLGKIFPKLEPYIPSPTGFGIAFVIPFFNSFSLFLGALIALIIEKRSARMAPFIIPVSSGLIAGESLMGIAVALLQAGKWI